MKEENEMHICPGCGTKFDPKYDEDAANLLDKEGNPAWYCGECFHEYTKNRKKG